MVSRRAEQPSELGDQLTRAQGVKTRGVGLDLGAATAVATLRESMIDLEVGLVVASARFGSCGPLLGQDVD